MTNTQLALLLLVSATTLVRLGCYSHGKKPARFQSIHELTAALVIGAAVVSPNLPEPRLAVGTATLLHVLPWLGSIVLWRRDRRRAIIENGAPVKEIEKCG